MTAIPATPATTAVDAADAAMNAQPASAERTYFGEVTIVDAYFCKLVKGQGKVLFDPSIDSLDQRRVAVKLQIEVPRRDGTTYTVDQDVLDNSDEWAKFTLPSLRNLKLNLKDLLHQHVQVKRRPTGSKYTNKTGDLKDRTALVFEAVFPDADACRVAAEAFYTRTGGEQSDPPAAAQTPAAQAAQNGTHAAAPVNEAERKFALEALPLLWNASGKNNDAFLDMIAKNPMVAKYFNAGSPEVRQYMTNDMAF